MPLRSGRAALALALLVLAAPAAGHEAERTRVTIEFSAGGRFVVTVAHDPAWLLLRLETFAGGTTSQTRTPAERDARLAELGAVFADRIVLFVDGREVRADTVEYRGNLSGDGSGEPGDGGNLPGDGGNLSGAGSREPGDESREPGDESREPGADLAGYRLTGTMPQGARELRWLYGMVADPYPLEIRQADGTSTIEWIHGTNWSGTIDLTRGFLRPTRAAIARQYLALGFVHILPRGLDHMLFVLGLFLLSPRLRPLLLQVTAFTVAHSITLALSIYGLFSLPPSIVEPLIALSIAYVAVENLLTSDVKPWRLALVFLFGLLHGLGFAGVLRDLGLPRGEFLTGLVSFNLGVEGGQLTVIAIAALAAAPFVRRSWYRRRVVIPASIAIAAIALYWAVTRLS